MTGDGQGHQHPRLIELSGFRRSGRCRLKEKISCYMKTQIVLIFVLSIAPVLTSAKSMDELLSHFASKTWKSPTEGTFLYRHSSPAKMEKEMKYPLLVFFTVLEVVVKTIKNNYSMLEVLRILKKIK